MDFPFHKQETKYTCAAAAMKMALEKIGIVKSEKLLAKLLKTNKVRGTWHKDFPRVAEKYRLTYFVKRNSSIKDLKKYRARGFVVIVCYYYRPEKIDHYSVLKKIDANNIYLWDPWFGPKHKYKLSFFRQIWKSNPKYEKEKRWFFAVKR